ncbi:MAG: PmoA family protein [Planctomycetaceae bacterium]
MSVDASVIWGWIVAVVMVAASGGNTWAQSLRLTQTDSAITITRDGKTVLAYNIQSPPIPEGIDPVYRRSGFLHPVCSPQGLTVTETFPADHPHQHGIFSAWVKTVYEGRAVDFWNLAGRTGRVLHERVVETSNTDDSTGFEVDLLHRVESQPPVDVLRERWKITMLATDPGYHGFDLETHQSVIGDKSLAISKYHYGGVAVRGPVRWLSGDERLPGGLPETDREPSRFINDSGSDRIAGNLQHAKWVALTGMQDGKPVSIAVLCHADNFRAPQAARLHPTKPYFCFAPCADGAFTIDANHPYHAKYRFLISDDQPDAAWLDEQWRRWCQP